MKNELRDFSLQLHYLQKPLRILPRVIWEPSIEARFHRGKPIEGLIKKLYAGRAMRFSIKEKLTEIDKLRGQISRRLGAESPAGSLLLGRLDDYAEVARLISAVGTQDFAHHSRRLWGSSHDVLFSDGMTIVQYAKRLQALIKTLMTPGQNFDDQKVIPAAAVIELMRAEFRIVHLSNHIELILSDKIASAAAAGSGKIKIRRDALFSAKDVQVLIYHEAYTHVATSMNGQSQPYAKFLGFDSPRCSVTQEGLAVMMEILSNVTYPQRLKKIADRVVAVSMAEDGADPKQVHDYLCGEGYRESEAYQLMVRAFRGTGLGSGEAFTKDIVYLRGLVENFNFIQFCLVRNQTELLEVLFAGKLHLSEIPALQDLYRQGIIKKPQWMPAQFLDLDALASYFVCSAALGQMGDIGLHDRFARDLSLQPKPTAQARMNLRGQQTGVATGDRPC